MKIAIPSYNRAKLLVDKTLKLLKDFDNIDLFLYDKEQKEIYEAEIDNEKVNIIITDILDLGERLNYILNEYYDEGEEVLLIEDDIAYINTDLLKLCKDGFRLCKEYNLYLWGISPTNNSYFHKEGYSTDFKFIIGVCYGVIVRKDKDLDVSITYKCDFERSILYHKKDGGMIRFNAVGVKTNFRALGGLGNDKKNNRLDKELEAVKEMIKKYPDYVYQNPKKSREIKFKKIKN
jgi:hypothetical protein